MKKIRLIGLVIAAALIVNLGVGCNKQKDIKILDTKDLNGKATPDKQVTLTFEFYRTDVIKRDMRSVLDEIEKKLKSTLNVKLDFQWNDGRTDDSGYNDCIKVKISSGEEPCEAFYYGEAPSVYNPAGDSSLNLQSIVKDNLAMDISELFPKYAPNLYNKYSKAELDSATVNGKLIAIPSQFPRAIISTAMVRNDLLKKYGIKSINSLDEYEAFLKLVKEKEPDLIPTSLGFDKKYMFLEQNGYVSIDYRSDLVYKRDDPNMKLNYYYDEPEYKVFENMLDRWKSNGYFKNSIGEVASTYDGKFDGSIIFSTGNKLASVIGKPEIMNGIWDRSYFTEISTVWDQKDYEVTNFMLFPDKVAQRVSPTDMAIIIPSTAKYPEKTLEFLEWVQSNQENYDLLMYGISGKNYSLYGDQLKTISGDYFGWQCSSAFWNFDFFRTIIDYKPTDKEKYKNLVESKSKYSENIGFLPDYTPIADKFADYKIDQKLSEGDKSIVLSEIQRQLDEWRKSKNK
jgi:putative aldouronate transport system substrate-binding protein